MPPRASDAVFGQVDEGFALAARDHDAAAKLGAKTFIMSGYIRGLPDGAAARHEFLTKRLGPAEIVAAVRQAIGSPVDEAPRSDPS